MTTDSFRFVSYPVRVHAGADAISSLADEVDRLRSQRVLIVCGQSVADKTDLVDRVKQALGERVAGVFSGGKTGSPVTSVLEGVTAAVSGFTGGSLKNPTYRGSHKGHYEAVEVSYDPARISYQQLLDVFWVNIDPFDQHGQFCDKGFSYLSAIFVANEEQRQLAEVSRSKVVKQFSANKVVTPILDSAEFWPVEKSHQDYYMKNPLRYKYYRHGCGRDQRLKTIWGDAAKH